MCLQISVVLERSRRGDRLKNADKQACWLNEKGKMECCQQQDGMCEGPGREAEVS